jgi:hypothetical protein
VFQRDKAAHTYIAAAHPKIREKRKRKRNGCYSDRERNGETGHHLFPEKRDCFSACLSYSLLENNF